MSLHSCVEVNILLSMRCWDGTAQTFRVYIWDKVDSNLNDVVENCKLTVAGKCENWKVDDGVYFEAETVLIDERRG